MRAYLCPQAHVIVGRRKDTCLEIFCKRCDKFYDKSRTYVFAYDSARKIFYLNRRPYARGYTSRHDRVLSNYYTKRYTKETGNVLMEC